VKKYANPKTVLGLAYRFSQPEPCVIGDAPPTYLRYSPAQTSSDGRYVGLYAATVPDCQEALSGRCSVTYKLGLGLLPWNCRWWIPAKLFTSCMYQ